MPHFNRHFLLLIFLPRFPLAYEKIRREMIRLEKGTIKLYPFSLNFSSFFNFVTSRFSLWPGKSAIREWRALQFTVDCLQGRCFNWRWRIVWYSIKWNYCSGLAVVVINIILLSLALFNTCPLNCSILWSYQSTRHTEKNPIWWIERKKSSLKQNDNCQWWKSMKRFIRG